MFYDSLHSDIHSDSENRRFILLLNVFIIWQYIWMFFVNLSHLDQERQKCNPRYFRSPLTPLNLFCSIKLYGVCTKYKIM